MNRPPLFSLITVLAGLVGCATPSPPPAVVLQVPAGWQAPLPHQGQLAELAHWWQRFDDPLLPTLIEAAQQVSPTLAAAASRIVQARSAQTVATAAQGPLADASASSSRGRQTTLVGAPLALLTQARLQASWEADLFGGLAANQRAASARLLGAQAQWHEARVSVAAEVARLYVDWRACTAMLAVARQDSASRSHTARLAQQGTLAGLGDASQAALAQAGSAEASAKVIQQKAQCDSDVKALVALTAFDEPDLRRKLAASPLFTGKYAPFSVASIPAQTLEQRPDLFHAATELAAASAELGSAQAERYPRLSLTGSVGQMSFRAGGTSTNISTWSIGPLALTLPVLDGGKFQANLAAATARYDEAAVSYRALARQAVREVEQALVALDSAQARRADVQATTDGYQKALAAAAARHQSGLGSLADLEDSHRLALAAHAALIGYQRETVGSWIALYRAVGGGWLAPHPEPCLNRASCHEAPAP